MPKLRDPLEPSDTIEILLVDDRPEYLLALEAVLAAPGYRLIKAASGDEALRYLLDHDPALVLMSDQMADLDGYETASLIKNTRRTRELPIIFLTDLKLDDSNIQKAYSHGAADCIHRSLDHSILRAKVAVFADLARKMNRLVQTEFELRVNERETRERQIAELELKGLKRARAEQKKYRDLVEGIDHGVVWTIDAETRLTSFVGPSTEKILGYSTGAWFGEADFFSKHLCEEDRYEFEAGLARIVKSKREDEFDHRFVASNGRIVWLRTGIRFSRSTEGKHVLCALSIDISQIKAAELALRRSKERSDFLAEASALLSESLDTEKSMIHFSRLSVERFCEGQIVDLIESDGKLRTVARSERTGDSSLSEFVDFQEPIRKVLRTGNPLLVPLLTEKKLAEWFPDPIALASVLRFDPRSLLIVAVPVRGRYVGTLTFISRTSRFDTSDLAMAEDLARRAGSALENASLYLQAQEAVRARDEFLSIASHELKTPLTPLKLQTQSLRRALALGTLQMPGSEKVARMLDSSDRQITRISRLIDDLLDISRISSGKMQLTFEEFRLGELFQDIIDRFEEEIKIARCTVEFQCDSKIMVCWDRFRIEQVIVNLLTNAIKYGAGASIEIHAVENDGNVVFSVRDHGIGIAEADQTRVFGRFERAVSGTHFGGLGLGLYIVTQILEAHSGTISLLSRAGEGSTFTVKLASRFSIDSKTGSAYSSPLTTRPVPAPPLAAVSAMH